MYCTHNINCFDSAFRDQTSLSRLIDVPVFGSQQQQQQNMEKNLVFT